MKRILFALPALLLFTQCSPAPESTPGPPPAEIVSTSAYADLIAKLDAGGVSYKLQDGEYEWEQIRPMVDFISGIMKSAANSGAPDMPSAQVMQQLEKLPIKLGLHEIYARGSSTVKLPGGGYRSKAVLQTQPQAQGWIWNLAGNPADLAVLTRQMPATTVMLSYNALNLPLLHQELQQELSAFPQVALALNQGLSEVRASGFPLDALMESVQQGFTLALTQNPENTWVLPVGQMPLSLPETGLVAVIPDADKLVFNYLLTQIENLIPIPMSEITLEGQSVQMLPVPAPVSTAVSLQMANVDGQTLITTSQPLMEELLQRRGGNQDSPLSAQLQQIDETTCFFGTIISPQLGEQIQEIMQRALREAQGAAEQEMMKPMMDFYSHIFSTIPHVSLIRSEGDFFSMELLHRSPLLPQYSGSATSMTVPMVGLMAAIALPGFQKARSTAQEKSCINNLRMIEATKDQWAIENNKDADAAVTESDIANYLHGIPTCPQGGSYELNHLDHAPTCSVHGSMEW